MRDGFAHSSAPPADGVQDALRVLCPPADDRNPYLRHLATALRNEGVDVRFGPPARFFRLWRAVAEHGRPDVVHLQWQHGYFTGRNRLFAVGIAALFFLQWATLRLFGVRFVWTVHNLVNHERWQADWELRCNRLLARLVDTIVVHCDAAADAVADGYGVTRDRLQVIPHGSYPVGAPMDKGDARRALGIEANDRVLLSFGSIRPYKGFEELLTDFVAVDADDAQLILAGEPVSGTVVRSLRSHAAADARVTLRLRRLTDQELVRHITAADLVVLPYRNILTSGAAIMSASCGRAVLAPALGCLGDLPSGAALHYDPTDSAALRTALRRVFSLPSERLEEMGRVARGFAQASPWTLVGAELRRIYERDDSVGGR